MTATGKKLMELLKNIYNDHDFVCGTMSNCGSEDAWKKMYDYISYANEHGETVTSDDVLALSLVLGDKKEVGKGLFSKHKRSLVASL